MLNIKLKKKTIKQLKTSNNLNNKMTPLVNGAHNGTIWEDPVDSKHHMSCDSFPLGGACRTANCTG